MKRIFGTLILISVFIFSSYSQGVVISESNAATPDGSAMLDVQSNSKGMLIPRLTSAQRTSISNTANGLLVFDTNTQSFWFYSTVWIELVSDNSFTSRETDPVFNSHPAEGITNSGSGQVITTSERNLLNSALQVETDPVFTDHPANSISNAGSGQVITNDERSKLNNIDEGATFLPTGTIIAYAGVTVPNGWLACEGNAVSRTEYADLYAAIGTTWGIGDGASTFNLPDFRGRFLRGWDNTAGNDPDKASRTALYGGNTGNKVGSYQLDAFQGHEHKLFVNATGSVAIASGQGAAKYFSSTHDNAYNITGLSAAASIGDSSSPTTDGTNGTPRNSSETRSKNANVYYIIKYTSVSL